MPILVIGGAGRTGSEVVKELQRLGQTTRVLSRRAQAGQGGKVVRGDITDLTAVREGAKDVSGVVIVVESSEEDAAPNSPERVHYQGTLNVVEALERKDVPLLLVSQIYITRPERYPEVENVIRWRGEAEQAVRESGQAYVIVRPSWLTSEPGGEQAIRLEQGDTGDGQVSRADVATVCAAALLQTDAHGKTFEVYAEAGTPPSDWATAFRSLRPDSSGGNS